MKKIRSFKIAISRTYYSSVAVFACLLISALPAIAQDYVPGTNLIDSPGNRKPTPFAFIKNLPKDFVAISTAPFKKSNLKNLAVVVGATASLIIADQVIYKGVRNFSDKIRLEPAEKNKTLWSLKAGNTKIVLLKIPQNLNTGLYNVGQGFTTMLIAGGFYLQGKISKNYTSLQTASDLTESFAILGVVTQILKYATGREVPGRAINNGGRWRPFPSLSAFQNNKSRYDAFPSGHLSTLMAAVTILSNNYPGKKWIRRVGYTLVALSGYAMINNGVHWAGDYPLAIGLGYLTGNIITSRHKLHSSKVAGINNF